MLRNVAKSFGVGLLFACCLLLVWILPTGCGQIGMPSGGPMDTLSPLLIKATPNDGAVNVQGNRITLEFNEYIDVQDLQQNLVVSPLQNRNPTITNYPRSINIRFRDTLLPNTTYTIDFGNAVRDINEGNVYKNLSYRFSTGPQLDTLGLNGSVIVSETGLPDSTWIVLLYRNAADSAVKKKRPNYFAKVDREGNFRFQNLPSGPFRIYALKDGDGGKTYNSLTEGFAFLETTVEPGTDRFIELNGYQQEPEPDKSPEATILAKAKEKTLRVVIRDQPKQDLLRPLELNFTNKLAVANPDSVFITDTFFRPLTVTRKELDSSAQIFRIYRNWQPDSVFNLVIRAGGFADSAKTNLVRSDTVRLTTKSVSEYGKLVLRFTNLDLAKKPVLEFLSGSNVTFSYALKSAEWSQELFPPGEYGVRILYDSDGNGTWTPGNFDLRRQPEMRVLLPQKINVKNNWDNEREISL